MVILTKITTHIGDVTKDILKRQHVFCNSFLDNWDCLVDEKYLYPHGPMELVLFQSLATTTNNL